MTPCVKCGRKLRPAFPRDDESNQPAGAVMCYSAGNYGSALFDPGNDCEMINFSLCDECAEAGLAAGTIRYRVLVMHGRDVWETRPYPPS